MPPTLLDKGFSNIIMCSSHCDLNPLHRYNWCPGLLKNGRTGGGSDKKKEVGKGERMSEGHPDAGSDEERDMDSGDMTDDEETELKLP